jgi:hypothetical protein
VPLPSGPNVAILYQPGLQLAFGIEHDVEAVAAAAVAGARPGGGGSGGASQRARLWLQEAAGMKLVPLLGAPGSPLALAGAAEDDDPLLACTLGGEATTLAAGAAAGGAASSAAAAAAAEPGGTGNYEFATSSEAAAGGGPGATKRPVEAAFLPVLARLIHGTTNGVGVIKERFK